MKLESGRRICATARLLLLIGYHVREGETPAKQSNGYFMYYVGQCEKVKNNV